MALWSVDCLVKEIEELSSLALARPNAPIIGKFAIQIQEQIDGIQEITPSQLIAVTEVIAKSSLDGTVKDALQNALDVRSLTTHNCVSKLVSKSQTLHCIWNYLSQDENEKIIKSPLPTMVQLVCTRLKRIGVKSMKEKTKKSIVAYFIYLLQCRGEPEPSSPEIYKLGKFLSDAFHSVPEAALVTGVAIYPTSPADLGQVPWVYINQSSLL